MPKLRRINGYEIIKILEGFGFEVIRIGGSHHLMRRIREGRSETINVPVDGHKALATGTLHSVYRDACRYLPEDEIRAFFYTE